MSDDGPGSSWQEHFSITDDLGCALPFIDVPRLIGASWSIKCITVITHGTITEFLHELASVGTA